MATKIRNLKYYLFVFFLLFFILVIILILNQVKKIAEEEKTKEELENAKIEIQDKDKTIIFNRDGKVEFKSPTNNFEQNWDQAKLEAILNILKREIEKGEQIEGDSFLLSVFSKGGSYNFNLDRNNSILKELFEEFEKEEEGKSGAEESSWFNNFFSSRPSPQTSFYPSPSYRFSRPEDCPLWLLSMCVYPPNWYVSPTPSSSLPTSPSPSTFSLTPSLKPAKTPVPPDCTLWDQLISGKTVISNTLCIKEGQ